MHPSGVLECPLNDDGDFVWSLDTSFVGELFLRTEQIDARMYHAPLMPQRAVCLPSGNEVQVGLSNLLCALESRQMFYPDIAKAASVKSAPQVDGPGHASHETLLAPKDSGRQGSQDQSAQCRRLRGRGH